MKVQAPHTLHYTLYSSCSGLHGRCALHFALHTIHSTLTLHIPQSDMVTNKGKITTLFTIQFVSHKSFTWCAFGVAGWINFLLLYNNVHDLWRLPRLVYIVVFMACLMFHGVKPKFGFVEFHILLFHVHVLAQNYVLYMLAKPMFTRCLSCCAPFGQHGVGFVVLIVSNREDMAQLGCQMYLIWRFCACGSRYMCSPSVDGLFEFQRSETWTTVEVWWLNVCFSHFHLSLVFASVTWWRTKHGRYRARNPKTSRICNWRGLACRLCVICVDMFLCLLFCETAMFQNHHFVLQSIVFYLFQFGSEHLQFTCKFTLLIHKKSIFQEKSEGEAERVEPEDVPYAKCRWDFFLSHWSTLCWIRFVKIYGNWTVWTQIEPVSQISQGHKQSNAQDAVQNLRLALSERFLGSSFWLDIEQVRKTMSQTKDVVLIFFGLHGNQLPKFTKYIHMWRHQTLRRVFSLRGSNGEGNVQRCVVFAQCLDLSDGGHHREQILSDGAAMGLGSQSEPDPRDGNGRQTWQTQYGAADPQAVTLISFKCCAICQTTWLQTLVSPCFACASWIAGALMIWRQSLPRMRSSHGFEIQNFDQSVWKRFFASAHRTPGGKLRLGRLPNRLCSLFEMFWFYISMIFNGQQSLSTHVCSRWICSETSPVHLSGCLSLRYANKGGDDDGAEVFDKSFVIFTAMCGVALPGVPLSRGDATSIDVSLHSFAPCHIVCHIVSQVAASLLQTSFNLCSDLVFRTPGSIFLMLLHQTTSNHS